MTKETDVGKQKTDLKELLLKGPVGTKEELVIIENNRNALNRITKSKFGSAKGMFKMNDDFDENLEDFKDYMN